uniref:Uncharacterized protein n=1 Tax=Plectus sambesii TaxID=2011161 RepID=A0A914W1B8_9BILA
MTLVLKIEPVIARDFSLMIQACGMTAAAFTIFWMQIAVEWRSVFFCTMGAVFGATFGFTYVDPLLNASQKKMIFVSVFFSFALALYMLNTRKKRTTFFKIQNFNAWKAMVLVCTGLAGGVFTSIVGSGVDVLSFSMLTLLFSVSEKVATPTSVILMAFNSQVCFFWRELIMADVSPVSWEYLAVCLPVVVVFAPLGSMLASHFHRLVLAYFIYLLETLALIGGFLVVRPDLALTITSICIIVTAFTFFFVVSRIGARMLDQMQKESQVKNVLLPSDIDMKPVFEV